MKSKSIIKKSNTAEMYLSRKVAIWALAVLLLSLLLAAGSPTSSEEPLKLKSGPLPFTPKEFYIASVVDERKNKSAIAYIFPEAHNTPLAKSTVAIDLEGGGTTALSKFLMQGFVAGADKRPIIARIKDVHVKETTGEAGRVNGQMIVHIAFEMQRPSGTIPLIEYKGGARYIRPASQHEVIMPTLSKALTESLRYFNTWIDREADQNELLAKALKVSFSEHVPDAVTNLDTVFYNPNRKLSWADFTANPNDRSKYAAAVFPSFAYEGVSEVKNGEINLQLRMKVFVVKGASWVKPIARNTYSLNHEQRHFDIVKIVAERFKQKIQPDNLTLEDYNSIIQYKYIESFREMNRMQEQYDQETKHGLDQDAQQRWNERIDKELLTFKIEK